MDGIDFKQFSYEEFWKDSTSPDVEQSGLIVLSDSKYHYILITTELCNNYIFEVNSVLHNHVLLKRNSVEVTNQFLFTILKSKGCTKKNNAEIHEKFGFFLQKRTQETCYFHQSDLDFGITCSSAKRSDELTGTADSGEWYGGPQRRLRGMSSGSVCG